MDVNESQSHIQCSALHKKEKQLQNSPIFSIVTISIFHHQSYIRVRDFERDDTGKIIKEA